jgi:thiamine-phosphate pyrophosphorylase
MGAVALIGLSTHSERQFADALTCGADYAAVGPVYSTPTKPGRPAVGLDLVGFAADRATLPVFAIGAVDETNLARVMEAGARRVSVVRALTESGDPASVANRMSAALRPPAV